MDKNKNYKIALVLYTSGIDYDDRIRKEILSIKEMYANIDFKIFAVEPKNREEEGVSSYGVPYRIPFLKTREKYTSGTHVLHKAWDFYKTVKDDLKTFDAVWCADIETFLFVLMIKGKPIAWDLHELPMRFTRKPIMKTLFRYLERKCRVMVHANEPRLEYLKQIGIVKHPEKQFVLRNYPQFNEIDTEYDALYHKFDQWVGESRCVYLQGLNEYSRSPYQSVKAVLSFPELKAVVIGRFDENALTMLQNEYGDNLYQRVFFTGMVKQLKTPQYIRRCCMSLVFYQNTNPNNFYCEANRFYQNIINNNPVVVGCNPPMRDLVTQYGFGISIDDDGRDLEKIIDGINEVIQKYSEIETNIRKNSHVLYWDKQKDILQTIVTKLFYNN